MSTATPTRQTTPGSDGARDTAPGPLYGILAEFETPLSITEAAIAVRAAGYKWWDTFTPFPVHGLDRAMGIKPTILPILVFMLGLGGFLAGAILQMFTNSFSFDVWALVWVRGYDFAVSGKPAISGQAFIPVMFELTILFAAVGCVMLMFALNKLPQWYHPVFKSHRFARATDDRFFVVIEARDPQFQKDRTEAFLRTLNPTSIESLEA
ncbi:MAG: DUF3341 domain-containing protein [Phycisphaerales bacterium]|nr:DUF3341 domain-containing protein [Phycisphaerales bacterium]